MKRGYIGISIRMTDKRNSFFTARDELLNLVDAIREKGKAFYASELSVNVGKKNFIRFAVFFDVKREVYYLGEIESIEHRKKEYVPDDCLKYGYDDETPHKTWILLKSLSKISAEHLKYIFVIGGEPVEENTLAEKIKEPRFPRVYVYISHDYDEYDAERAVQLFSETVDEEFVRNAFGLST